MHLPRLYVVLDQEAAARGVGNCVDAAVAAADAGARLFQVRAPGATGHELWALAEHASVALAGYGAKVLVNDRVDIALGLGCDGVHRPQHGIGERGIRRLLESQRILGVSCHDAAEVRRAEVGGADFVTVSPVFETGSKPGAVPIGLIGLAELADATSLPVFALGGVTAETAAACVEAGAHGVCVLSAIMAAVDPHAATVALLAALGD